MKLYGIPNCSTVKKTRDWLAQHAIDYLFHDYKKQGLDMTTALDWLSQHPWETLINRSGMTWRNLTESEKSAVQDADSAARLMLDKPSVIKRPLLVQDGKIIAIGFKEAEYAQLFCKA